MRSTNSVRTVECFPEHWPDRNQAGAYHADCWFENAEINDRGLSISDVFAVYPKERDDSKNTDYTGTIDINICLFEEKVGALRKAE